MRKALAAIASLMWMATSYASNAPAWKDKADAILHEVSAYAPGASVAIVEKGQLVYSTSRGLASVELNVPLIAASRFRIGSLTKTVTAAAILKLQADGQLNLDDPLAKWLPNFLGSSGITIRELLNHTSGVSDAWDAPLAEVLSTEQRLALIGKAHADFPPGTDWRYSNSGYMVLGAVLEKVTGLSWSDAARKLVLEPLGIDGLGYHDDSAVVRGLVPGYTSGQDGRPAKPALYSISGPGAAGALDGDATSVATLLHRLGTSQGPWPVIFKSMTTPTRVGKQDIPYGMGTVPGRLHGIPIVEHAGGIEGYSAYYVYAMGQDLAVVVLENSDSPKVTSRSLARRIAGVALGVPYRTFEPAAWPAQKINALAGSYVIEGDSRHAIAIHDGAPWIRRDDGPEKRLVPAAGNVLFYAGDGTDFIEPVQDGNGVAHSLKFHSDGEASFRVEAREKSK